jgi:predicted nucleotide-binding protein
VLRQMNDIDLIRSLIDGVSTLPHRNDEKLDALKRRTKMIFTKIFGSKSSYLQDLEGISFHPQVYFSGMKDSPYNTAWHSGKSEMSNLLKTALEELELNSQTSQKDTSTHIMKTASNQVFVVHGHDEEMKSTVARALEKLGLQPIILHEQPDKGRTVIEKFIGHSEVPFAIVLFSPDDMAYRVNAQPETARPRARQNVVLELGFFLGKLGRANVLVLHRQAPNFELPSDYAGVLFKPFDANGAWRSELVRELKAAGFQVSADNLL